MNPIIGREVRTRWRGIKAFGLVLGYAAPLAIAIVLAYDSALPSGMNVGTFRARHLGQEVFMTLAVMQVLGWMLFAPTLTATTIAGEREHGLLESLQLSHLTPWQIVSGKLASALLFVLLAMVAALPVQAICLMMGGVSPGEFTAVFALSFSTAIVCAALGITCSAWSRRGGIAFRSAFILVVIWGIGSGICWGISSTGAGGIGFFWYYLTRAIGLTNPIAAAVSIISPDSWMAGPPAAAMPINPVADFLLSIPLWGWCMLIQLVATVAMLWSSTRAVRRPLPEQYWIEPSAAPGSDSSQPGNKVAGSGGRARSRQRQRAWWEVPVLSQLRFSNPVLMREARGKFRLRQVPTWVLAFEAMLALGVGIFYCYLVYWALFEPYTREGIWWGITGFGFFILMLSTAIMGAGAFTREREAGTWDGLMLSIIPSKEILFGKAVAILLTCLLISIPVWPLLALCVRPSDGSEYVSRNGIIPIQAFLTLAIIVSTCGCYLALAMLVSWCCRRTSVAVGWTLGLLFAANILLPMIWSTTVDYTYSLLAHPWIAMGAVGSMGFRSSVSEGTVVLTTIIVHTILGMLLFGILADFMVRERP